MNALRIPALSDDMASADGDDGSVSSRVKHRSDGFAPADGPQVRPLGPPMRIFVQIAAHGRVYCLSRAFAVTLKRLDDGTVFASHATLPVYGYGETVNVALRSFQEMFDVQYRSLVDGSVDDLAPRARVVREDFRGVVERVVVRRDAP